MSNIHFLNPLSYIWDILKTKHNNFAIAAGHDATAATAAEILRAGGNAFDAAIAAYLTAFVAEPCMASGGGGAFANVRTAEGQAQVYDFFCQTPIQKRPLGELDFFPIEVDFGSATEIFHVGKGSTGVPGSIAGIYALHERLGTMPMSELVKIPIQYAKEGVAINGFQAYDIELLKQILCLEPHGRALFLNEKGNLKGEGEVIKMEGLADFLEYMGREGKAAFYKGEVAEKIIRDYRDGGGYLTQKDFDQYEVIVRSPLSFSYQNKTILTNPLPSIGGALLNHMLDALPATQTGQNPLGDEHLLQLHSALQHTDQLSRLPEDLAHSLRHLYDRNKKHGSTSHFNILDQWGNAISLTMTIGEGCGYFVEGTDIQLNNMLGEAALSPKGFHTWDENVRLSSMMAPTIVLDENQQAEIISGSGGASRIASAIAQVLHYLIDYQLPVEQAVNLPRVHLEHGVFNLEAGFKHQLDPSSFQQEFKEWDKQSLFFGGVHTILKRNGHLTVSGDDRRDGVAHLG